VMQIEMFDTHKRQRWRLTQVSQFLTKNEKVKDFWL